MTFDQIFLFIFLYFSVIIILLFIQKIRSIGKVRVLILKPSLKFNFRKVKAKENKLIFSKDYKPEFETNHIFEEEKSPIKFWRNPFRMVILPEKANQTIGWKNPNQNEIGDLARRWTEEEVKKVIKKEVAKARTEMKPPSNLFLILAILVLLNLIISGLMFMKFLQLGV